MNIKQKCCTLFTIGFYIFIALVIIACIVLYTFVMINDQYDDVLKINILGESEKTKVCGYSNMDGFKTFQFTIVNNNDHTFQCGFEPAISYLVYLTLFLSLGVVISIVVAGLVFRRASYSFGLFIFGGITAILFIAIICWQIYEVKRGYNYCTNKISSSFKNKNISINCKYTPFIIPMILESVLVLSFVLNPFIGCQYILITKPYVPKKRQGTPEYEMKPNQIEDDEKK
ncbi:hypothetical protein ENUP19_0054G0094 [Entamoeba nuttalli]|uniref:Transmembrane protein n=1 Tax=Entamoeba nuttalli TaxID=412467 RepID=A0ABQ0DCC7_9EUKA